MILTVIHPFLDKRGYIKEYTGYDDSEFGSARDDVRQRLRNPWAEEGEIWLVGDDLHIPAQGEELDIEADRVLLEDYMHLLGAHDDVVVQIDGPWYGSRDEHDLEGETENEEMDY